MKLKAKYEKGQLPPELAGFAVERDGFMFLDFDDDVALATNPALAQNNASILNEKKALQTKYDNLVTSSGDLARQVNELTTTIASGGQVSANELAIVKALKGIENATPDEVKKIMKEYPTVVAELTNLKAQAQNSKLAKALGFKETVFNDFLNHPDRKDVKFLIESVNENGATVEKVYVESKDAQGVVSKQVAQDFIKASPVWQEYLPALQAAKEETGPAWLAHSPAGGDPPTPKNAIDEHIQKMNAQATKFGNALIPAPQAPAQPTA